MPSWQDEIFEAWWEDERGLLYLDVKEVARLAFHQGWDAAEDR